MAQATFFHLCAYSSSIAQATTYAQLNAVADSILTLQNNSFLLPEQMQLLLAASLGVTLSQVRLNTPKMRYVSLPSLIPVNRGATVPSPPNIVDFTEYPLTLNKVDGTEVDVIQALAGAETEYVGLWLSIGLQTVPPGPVWRIHGTATITAVSGAWANGTITLDNTLPNGTYAIVGMDCVGANLLFARLIYPGAAYRPGCLCRNALANIQHPIFTNGKLGNYGTFDMPNLPNLEVMSVGANSAQDVYLDVIKVGGLPI